MAGVGVRVAGGHGERAVAAGHRGLRVGRAAVAPIDLGGESAAVALLSASVNVTTVTLEAARPWVTFTLTPTAEGGESATWAVLVAPAVAVPGALSTTVTFTTSEPALA